MRYGSSSGTPVWKCFATPYAGLAEKTLFDDAAGFTAGSCAEGDRLGDERRHLVGDGPRVRQLVEEGVDLAVVELGGARAQERDDAARRVRGDVRVAVAVAAHPRRDGDGGGVGGERLHPVALQEAVDPAVVLGHRAPQRLLDDRHPVARLALRRRLRPPHRRRPPRRRQLAPDQPDAVLELARRAGGREAVVLLEELDHPLLLAQDRLPLRLRRVRGEDEVDLLRRQRAAHRLRRDARRDELVEGRLEGGQRRALVRAEVGALARLPRPQLRVRVGEVGDREHLGHRVRALHEVLGRHRLDALGEAGELGLVRLGEREEVRLDGGERRRARRRKLIIDIGWSWSWTARARR